MITPKASGNTINSIAQEPFSLLAIIEAKQDNGYGVPIHNGEEGTYYPINPAHGRYGTINVKLQIQSSVSIIRFLASISPYMPPEI